MEQFKLDDSGSSSQGPDFSGGPNFGQPDGWDDPQDGWFSRYGSTVVLPIIAILVLAGGIYLYATQKSAPTAIEEADDLDGDEISLINDEGIDEINLIDQDEAIQPTENTEPKIEVIIPEPKKTSEAITETAIAGDGITRLARRSLSSYLSDNPNQGNDLTNEHKIYIEDYLKDNTTRVPVHVGDEISFSKDLIQNGISASKTLTENQLKNLEKYSALVAW